MAASVVSVVPESLEPASFRCAPPMPRSTGDRRVSQYTSVLVWACCHRCALALALSLSCADSCTAAWARRHLGVGLDISLHHVDCNCGILGLGLGPVLLYDVHLSAIRQWQPIRRRHAPSQTGQSRLLARRASYMHAPCSKQEKITSTVHPAAQHRPMTHRLDPVQSLERGEKAARKLHQGARLKHAGLHQAHNASAGDSSL